MGSPGFMSVSLSKTGISYGDLCLTSSIMLKAGVDTKLEEEGVELSIGEGEDDGCSSKSRGGRYGLYGVSVCMGANAKRWVGAVLSSNKLAFVVGVDVIA